MTPQDVKTLITTASLETQLIENETEYTAHFYKIEHLLTGISILNFSMDSFSDYINKIFSPEEQLNSPSFYNIIEEGADGEILVFTVLLLVLNTLPNHQSVCASQDDMSLLHLVTLDEFHNPNVKK